jgi:acetyltransferase-like isoleucine patch superfamily enzyme
MIENVKLGKGVKIWRPDLVNLYDCVIGDECNIGAFVEIGKGVVVGKRVRIGAHAFIPTGVTIEDDCFVGPRVTFTNDKYPPGPREDWGYIIMRKGSSLGAACVVLPGVVIGECSLVGAGSIITRDIPPYSIAVGIPARVVSGVGVKKEDSNDYAS